MSAVEKDPGSHRAIGRLCMAIVTALILAAAACAGEETTTVTQAKVRLATGNLSVDAIQHSVVGANPDPKFRSDLPSSTSLTRLREAGLDAYEDYVAWGMIEPKEGAFDFSHHERVYSLVTSAGLQWIPYLWCHVPPTWLRDDPRATLMRCNAHGQPCYMLSIFDPQTIEWYRHFYEALHRQFGARIPETYACILGPYGEGNYPLPYVDWVLRLGHCHEGYWCGDSHALPAFRRAMERKYAAVTALNAAWDTSFTGFADVRFPEEITSTTVASKLSAAPKERRCWLDFIQWYHAALIDFAGRSTDAAIGVFGRGRVATKPGGNAGWMNPVSWGTYCPGFAKMAGGRGIAVQSADSRGAYWADKWCSTAYAFYGAEYRTEAAGALDRCSFLKRTFSDVSCGAARLFTYEIDQHLSDSLATLHLFTGERGRTSVALLAPTTKYLLCADVMSSVDTGTRLRDVFDYDVVDELLVRDGILDARDAKRRNRHPDSRYRIVIAIGCDVVEAAILHKLTMWVRGGGNLVWASDKPVQDVAGKTDWAINGSEGEQRLGKGTILRVAATAEAISSATLALAAQLGGSEPLPGFVDGKADNVWITEFSSRLLLINLGDGNVRKEIDWKNRRRAFDLRPFSFHEETP